MMMHWGNFGGMGYGGFGWIIMILFWALVILGIVYIFKQVLWGNISAGKGSAEDILKRRYAAGEVTTDEYYERLKVLSS